MNSGISITTGGTTISATLADSSSSRPRKRMLAIANAASAATIVEAITAPAVRITEFLNQVRNSPPSSASEKLPNVSGEGRPSTSSEYWSSLFTDVIAMNSTGIIAPMAAMISRACLR